MQVLQMESTVLNFLKFEMTAPTIKCFLRRFVRAAQGIDEVSSVFNWWFIRLTHLCHMMFKHEHLIFHTLFLHKLVRTHVIS